MIKERVRDQTEKERRGVKINCLCVQERVKSKVKVREIEKGRDFEKENTKISLKTTEQWKSERIIKDGKRV